MSCIPQALRRTIAAVAGLGLALAIVPATVGQSPAGAAEKGAAEKGAADTAVLKIVAANGTQVFINGAAYGPRRDYSFPGMEAGRLYRYEIQAVLPDGRQVTRNVLLQGGWQVELPLESTAAVRPELVPQTGHALPVWAVAFSPDGRYVLTGSLDAALVLWDARSGRQLRTLHAHQGPVRALAFSPDGKYAASGSFDGTAILWNPRSGEVLQTLRGPHHFTVWSVAFSPDGRYLATDEILWDTQTGRRILSLPTGKGLTGAVAFSPDGRFLATGGFAPGFNVKIWDARTKIELRSLTGHQGNVNSLAFSPDGRTLVSAAKDAKVICWDTSDGRPLRTLQAHTAEVASVAFSPDGRYLVTGGYDQQAILWDARSGRQLRAFAEHGRLPGQDMVWAARFSPDGRQVVAGVGINAAVVWDAATGRKLQTLQGATTMVGAAAFTADGRHIQTSIGLSGYTWDAQSGRPAGMSVSPGDFPAMPITALTSDQDARHVLVSAADKTHHLYDVQSGRQLQVFRDKATMLYGFACSPDARRVITGSDGPAAYLWDVAGGTKTELAGHTGKPMSAAFSPDGQYAITGSFDKTAVVWDVAAGRKLQTLTIAGPGVSAVAISRGARRAVCGESDGRVSLWDVAAGRTLQKLKNHSAMPWCVAFSDDDRYLITGGWDNRVNLWEAESGQLLRTFAGHANWISSARLSPDHRYLVSASHDGTARLWDVATGKELIVLLGLNAGKDWLAITPEGLFDGSRLGREMVSFRFGGELQVVPVDRFFQDFYRPGLLSEIWRGGRPEPEVRLGGAQPPAIRILSPQGDRDFAVDRVTLEVEVTDQGGGILGPWLVQNGARVIVPGSTEKKGHTVRRTFDVHLTGGENRFEVRAASGDGAWECEPAVLAARYRQTLPKPDLHLLVVGVNRYADRSLDLAFPRGDAESLGGLFRLRGADLYGNVHLASLIDQEATREAILAKLRRVAAETRPQDTLIAYFSGHGVMAGTQFYYLPHEVNVGGETAARDAQRQGLAAADVGELLAQAAALKRVLLFDTGQTNGRLWAARSARNPFAFRGAIEELSRAEGAFTLAAAPTSAQAREVPELGHGVLTYALLAGLHAVDKGPLAGRWIQPDAEDRVAGVLEWFSFAAQGVPELSEKYFGARQEVQQAHAGSNFPLLALPAGAAPQPPVISALASRRPAAPALPTDSAAAASGDLPTVHVIAVGINNYRTPALGLQLAVPDATAICELFQRRATALYGAVKPHLVTDEQATRAGILGAVKSVAAQAAPKDLVVLYLAGHGAMAGQRYYFVPQDFQQRSGQIADDLRAQGIPGDELADLLADVPALKQVLILDTCASGAAVQLGKGLRDPLAFRAFVERLGRRQGIFTIAATAAGDEAQEVAALGHGVLTYALLAALRAAPPGPLDGKFLHAANARGQADVLDWFSYASGQVPRLTRRFLGKEQYVQTSGQGQSFPVLSLGP